MGSASHSSGLSHDLEYMLKTNCEIFDLPPHFNAEDTSDFRPALLKFMATATPDPRVASDILNHFSRHRDAMAITPVSHFAPSGEHSIEFTVDNVPEAVNPVKTKLAYIQVPSQDGARTELHLVWKVCRFSTHLYHSHTYRICSLKLRCKIIGMKQLFPPPHLTRSSLSLTGPQMLLFQYLSLKSLAPIMSLHGVSTIQALVVGQ